jgi:hypothetical protein
MTIKINTDSTFKYLQVFNGILELTQKELAVLAELIDVGHPTNLCTVDTKKQVAKNVGIEDFNTLNNYIKRLKDKGAIIKKNNKYVAVPYLVPNPETTIRIIHG